NHLAKLMTRIDCRAGRTQIGKILAHAKRETGLLKVSALVFVGDAFEEDEDKLLLTLTSSDALAFRSSCSRKATTARSSGSFVRSPKPVTAPIAASTRDQPSNLANCSGPLRPMP